MQSSSQLMDSNYSSGGWHVSRQLPDESDSVKCCKAVTVQLRMKNESRAAATAVV